MTSFTFNVSLAGTDLELSDDTFYVTGEFDGWASTHNPLTLIDEENKIYSAVVTLESNKLATSGYIFRFKGPENQDFENLNGLSSNGNVLIDDTEGFYNRFVNNESQSGIVYIFGTNEEFTYPQASSSGDPHIFPIYGKMFELSQKPQIYRMLDGKDIVMNASTKSLTTKQKNDIVHYFNKKCVFNDFSIDQILTNGVFYDSIYLCSDSHELSYNFNTQKLTMSKKSSSYFSFEQKKKKQTSLYNNQYEKCEHITQFVVSFKHSKYGQVKLDLNYFSNPQIKYGIGFSSRSTKSLCGLLVREYILESMTLESIKDVSKIKGIEGKNRVNSQLLIFKN